MTERFNHANFYLTKSVILRVQYNIDCMINGTYLERENNKNLISLSNNIYYELYVKVTLGEYSIMNSKRLNQKEFLKIYNEIKMSHSPTSFINAFMIYVYKVNIFSYLSF